MFKLCRSHRIVARYLTISSTLLLAGNAWAGDIDPYTPTFNSSRALSFSTVNVEVNKNTSALSKLTPRAASMATADPTATGQELIVQAMAYLGTPYRAGGTSPEQGFDCSGLIRQVFQEARGITLPRRAEEMSRVGDVVSADRLEPGDLVFFNTLRRAFSHVGIYLGDDRFIHAPSSGGEVRVETISSAYWHRRYDGARRINAWLSN